MKFADTLFQYVSKLGDVVQECKITVNKIDITTLKKINKVGASELPHEITYIKVTQETPRATRCNLMGSTKVGGLGMRMEPKCGVRFRSHNIALGD